MTTLAADGRLIMQAFYYFYPELDAYQHADWFIDIVRNGGWPFKFAWADLENYRVVMDPATRVLSNKRFVERMHLDYLASGVYTAKWYNDAFCTYKVKENGVDVTHSMNDWLGGYFAWVAHYGKRPSVRTMMSWAELKQNWLPNYDVILMPSQVNRFVGHQFTGDRAVLPGFYQQWEFPWTIYGGRRPLDVSVFDATFLKMIANNQVPTPPVPPPPAPVQPNTYFVNIKLMNVRSSPDDTIETNKIGVAPFGHQFVIDTIQGKWAHFIGQNGFPNGGWLWFSFLTKLGGLV